KITDSMQMTIDETNRRREKQLAYNDKHGITPQAIVKDRHSALSKGEPGAYIEPADRANVAADPVVEHMNRPALEKAIAQTKKAMHDAAKNLEFLEAARLRDEMIRLEDLLEKQKSRP
ncbi:MAG: UvrB/UvrC motif-containing protein, partial [Bacteroidales bacterium]|nr:UvrB/UvrC motif-containing protein [Bacteroidales bacterium]